MTAASTHSVTDADYLLRRRLRDALMEQVEDRNLSPEDLAEIVGMLPSGARALMARKDWPLTTCIRVAESLGFRIDATVQPRA